MDRELKSKTMQVNSQSEPKGKNGFRKMYLAALAALSFAVAVGMVCGYSASATADMKRKSSPVRPSLEETAWIGSIMALGAVLGGIIASMLCNKLGRKGTLMLSSIPFLIGWLFIAYAKKVVYIYLGRFITGFCVGLVCVTTPPYLIEISTPDVRGLLGSSFQLFIVIGVLIVNSLGATLSWEWLAVLSLALVILSMVTMLFVPESPRWLIGKGGYQEAVSAVKFLQGDYVDASAECVAIDEDLRNQPKGSISLKELLKPDALIPALLSFGLVFFQQTTGSNAILFYTVDIFSAAGSQNAKVSTIIIDGVLVVATAVSSGLMDKAGRKSLLILSGIGMAISLFALGTYDQISESNPAVKSDYNWVPLVCLIIYIATFSIGFGPIPWLMMAEMTPLRTRSVICGAATALCWTFVFIITKTFQALEVSIHDYGAYFVYAGFSVLSVVFTIFCLPETKGKQVEEIQQLFLNYCNRKKSPGRYEEMS
ncbi:Facilitated trehalose transporter Tret1 like protein [Argiope bruennichi]|uniref:Facilitated trehalose transporter Tret1 like protein n=1 Tax=Argiope bruennichi TaxID=94029 RepID=A0A8T0F304_ARGBR|nr:Facilitated trehalose transporter Tret1 like protein [Argiope bruennichi]